MTKGGLFCEVQMKGWQDCRMMFPILHIRMQQVAGNPRGVRR